MKTNWLQKLQARWGVESLGQVLIILLVFALTGSSVMYLKKFVLPFIGISEETSLWVRILASIFVILPLYQVLLLFFGFILGQFNFFWAFEKKTFSRIIAMFGRKEK
jgi:hypothetical protein